MNAIQFLLLSLLAAGLQAFEAPASYLRGDSEHHRELGVTCGLNSVSCSVQSKLVSLSFNRKKHSGRASAAAKSYLETIQGIDAQASVTQAFDELSTLIESQTPEQNGALLSSLLDIQGQTEKAIAAGTGGRLLMEGQRGLAGLISNIINAILGLISGIFNLIFGIISAILNLVGSIITGILTLISNIIKAILNLLTGKSAECAQSLISCQLDVAMKQAFVLA